MGWSSPYIPDLTERFPEGFDGVDLTDSYYPSMRGGLDPLAYMSEINLPDNFDDSHEDEY